MSPVFFLLTVKNLSGLRWPNICGSVDIGSWRPPRQKKRWRSFLRVRKSSTSCSSICKPSAKTDLRCRNLGSGKYARGQSCFGGDSAAAARKAGDFVRKSRRYESHMTTSRVGPHPPPASRTGPKPKLTTGGRPAAGSPSPKKGLAQASGRKVAIRTSANEASCPTGKRASRRSFASLLLMFRPTVTLGGIALSRSQDGGKKPLGGEWWPDP